MSAGYILTQRLISPHSGFILPEAHNDNFRQVISVGGPLTTDFNAVITPPCQVGDTICIGANYLIFQAEGQEYQVVKFQDVVSVVEGYAQRD